MREWREPGRSKPTILHFSSVFHPSVFPSFIFSEILCAVLPYFQLKSSKFLLTWNLVSSNQYWSRQCYEIFSININIAYSKNKHTRKTLLQHRTSSDIAQDIFRWLHILVLEERHIPWTKQSYMFNWFWKKLFNNLNSLILLTVINRTGVKYICFIESYSAHPRKLPFHSFFKGFLLFYTVQ